MFLGARAHLLTFQLCVSQAVLCPDECRLRRLSDFSLPFRLCSCSSRSSEGQRDIWLRPLSRLCVAVRRGFPTLSGNLRQ